MNRPETTNDPPDTSYLVLGATGKTGRRVLSRLQQLGHRPRVGSRSGHPGFDWNDPPGWDANLEGVASVYINYAPDLAVEGASDSIAEFVESAVRHGVRHLVLLSGRGEPEAQKCEQIVQESGLGWTVVRASWFNQNFSEGAFVEMVQAGRVTLPAGEVAEPFVDADDIADVAAAALTQERHVGQVYEVTGPRLLTFAEAAAELSHATGRTIEYQRIAHRSFVAGVEASGAPSDVVWMMDYLFSNVLDGRNACLADGVQRALGRPPRDFRDYAIETAATNIWRAVA